MFKAAATPTKRRGEYRKYDEELRAKIGRYANVHGLTATARHFSKVLDHPVSHTTVSSIKKNFDKTRKSQADLDPESIRTLPHNQRGRPLLLGSDVDSATIRHLKATRAAGGIVNTRIAIATAMGIAKAMKPSLLKENGGFLDAQSRAFGKSLLSRMCYVKRKGTKACKKVPDNLEELRSAFVASIASKMAKHNIPPSLVINLDETGLPLVPVSQWTLAEEGSKQVPITGLDDKRQITGLLACTLSGNLLPPQLIYEGKTERCHPKHSFPPAWDIFHSLSHWATHTTMVRYVEKILQPWRLKEVTELQLPHDQKALVIMDVFKAHRTPDVLEVLEAADYLLVFVPANCTSEMQPLDLSLNHLVKHSLRTSFTNWYAQMVAESVKSATSSLDEAVASVQPDLRLSNLKPLHAGWVVTMMADLAVRKDVIIDGWSKAGVIIDEAGKVSVEEDVEEKEDLPLIADDIVPLCADFGSLDCSVWRATNFHEWTLPCEVSQHRLDGRNGSNACSIIAAEVVASILSEKSTTPLPESGLPPSSSLISLFVNAMRRGNELYNHHSKRGLLSIDDTLALPEVNLKISANGDLGFWNRTHCQEKIVSIAGKLMQQASSIGKKAAIFTQTPYTMAVIFAERRVFIFDSHSHGCRGALIAASSKYASPEDVAEYVGGFMARHFKCRCPSAHLAFVEKRSSLQNL